MTSHHGLRAVPYLELLRQRGEPPESVRLRVALDVLGSLARIGVSELTPREAESPGIDRVVVDDDGRVALTDPGDGTGIAFLVWEVLAGRPAEGRPGRLHDVLDEIHPDVDAVVEEALRAIDPPGSVEQLAEDLAAAAQGRIATREKVTLHLGSAPRRSTPPSSTRSPGSTRARRSSASSLAQVRLPSAPPVARTASVVPVEAAPGIEAAALAPPTTEGAAVEVPAVELPAVVAPAVEVPAVAAPAAEAPSAEPAADAPAVETPTIDVGAIEAALEIPALEPALEIPPSEASAEPPATPTPTEASTELPTTRAALEIAPPPAIEATPDPTPDAPTANAAESDFFDEDWTTSPEPANEPPRDAEPPPSTRRPSIHAPDDALTAEQQARAAAIQRRAQERAAFVRDGARAVAARKLAAEYAAAERAAEEARLAERARLAEEEARAVRERDAATLAEAEALRHVAGAAAQLLTGALEPPRAIELPARSVLLVMPSSPQRDELSRALRDAGFGLSVHHDAQSALAAAPRIQPACIVADYDLPDATGDAAARQLRTQRSELALTPFLLLAFHTGAGAGLSRFALGADVCMAKPFEADEVVGQVAALVNMAERLVSARRAFPTLERGSGRGFGGDLIHMSIAAILTVVELERRTGIFHLTSDGRAAALEIAGGLLVSGAVSGLPMAPVGALRVMLAWRNGRFAFEPQPHREPPEHALSITDTLTAAMRYERAQPLHFERPRDPRPTEAPAAPAPKPDEPRPRQDPAPGPLRLRPRDSKGR